MKLKIPHINIHSVTHGENELWNVKDYFVTEDNIRYYISETPTRYKFYTLILITSGYIKVILNGNKILCSANDFIVLSPIDVFEVMEISEDNKCRVVAFNKDFVLKDRGNIYLLDKFKFLNEKSYSGIKFNKKNGAILNRYFILLRKRMEQESHKFRHEIIKNTIINLLYEIENIYLSKKIYDTSSYGKEYSKSNKELIKSEFLRLIKKDYRQNRQVSFYATTLNISVRYLGRIIKDTSGSTPKELIDELVVSEAKVLLTMRKYNITEVAYALNFSSMADFSRFFKKKTGVSPSHFMKL